MNKKYDDFIKMFHDNVMILPDCEGRAVLVETDEGLDRNVMVSVDSVNPNEGMILIASFKIKKLKSNWDPVVHSAIFYSYTKLNNKIYYCVWVSFFIQKDNKYNCI